MRKKIHIPNFKEAGIGFTMVPTCVLESPQKWGLSKNALMVYANLIARIKKEQFFNGRVLKSRMKGLMGESAVSESLKELCDNGFCVRKVHRIADGKMAGWDYQFFAIPAERAIVASVDANLAEKLEAIGWFDVNLSSNWDPSEREPDRREPQGENRQGGKAPIKEKRSFNSKEGVGKESVEKKIDPKKSPLNPSFGERGVEENDFSGEGNSDFSGEKDSDFPRKNDSDFPGEKDSDFGEMMNSSPGREDLEFRGGTGRWLKDMLCLPGGELLLRSLSPEQVLDDKALRRPANMLKKGNLPATYVAFLVEKVIEPNKANHLKKGTPLLTIAEILAFEKKPETSSKSDHYRRWTKERISSLNSKWQRLNQEFRDPNSLSELAASKFSEMYQGFPDIYELQDAADPPTYLPSPFEFLIFLKMSQDPEFSRRAQSADRILAVIAHRTMWEHLKREATINLKEFFSLQFLVEHFGAKLPGSHPKELEDLNDSWREKHDALKKEIEDAFKDMGSQPPAIEASRR